MESSNKKMSFADLAALFMTPRNDHPGRRGPVIPKSSCKDAYIGGRRAEYERIQRLKSKAVNG
jgi:hypothetical protein